MTFKSIFVEKHESEIAAKAPYVSGANYSIFGSLNAYTWPHSLKVFADENGLAIDWVDNCWIRVCVNGSQLRSFLALGNELTAMAAEARSTDWYVINEEEY
jgi:hypothetical protein